MTLFTAGDFDSVLERAIGLGRQLEQAFRNERGQEVCWLLKEILTLDVIAGPIDGAEIHHESLEIPGEERRTLSRTLRPEDSRPRQTI